MSPRLPRVAAAGGHPGVTIAVHATDLKLGTLRSIIKQAGFTVGEFLELL
jgi:predicted RNA binding protein YcfA (HicA-like mRNA interferase family)